MGISFCGDVLTKEEESNSRKSILRDIKSPYIINKIFSYLNENRKLNIIKYSKFFQNILSINIEYYKKISGKYKIDGINGNVEEYGLITDIIIFKGEYKNGKRNGKGKEFNDFGDIIFEGEYLDGKKWNGNFISKKKKVKKRNQSSGSHDDNNYKESILSKLENGKGIIKLYDDNQLLFEGEYLNGERNGRGKEYFHYGFFDREYGGFIYKGCVTYEGEYLNDKKWNGKAYDNKGKEIYEIKNGKGNIKEYNRYGDLSLECEIVNGEKNGKCKEYRNNTLVFEGKYFNGKKWNGKEYDYNNHLIYEGEYLNGKRWNGKYKEYNNDNLIFEGEIFNGNKWNEKGYDNKGNIIYEIKNGNGKIKEIYDYNHCSKQLIIYEKEYLNEETNKNGKIYDCNNRLIYEGELLNEKKNGKGKEYDSQDRLKYEGEYLDNLKNGKGKEYSDGELIFEGEFKDGEMWNGYGKKEFFEGEFKKGKMWNGKFCGQYQENNASYLKNGEGYIKFFDNYGELLFEGEYKNGERNGKGKEYFNNELEFEGEYKDGYRFKGKKYAFHSGYEGRLEYEGEFLYGEKNGKGKEYDCNGNLIFEGDFENGEKIE